MRLGTPLPPVEPLAGPLNSLATVRRLGEYELLEEIARGGMGVVYRARQTGLNRDVAVKVLLGGEFANEHFAKRFRREAEAAASLNHPNIVSIYEVGEEEGRPYFSMELIEGRSLAELVREKPLAAVEAARVLKTIAEAVQFAHERRLLHRDLKPSNVLLDAREVPHITDFGLAKHVESDGDLTQTGQILGTPNYMAPEQADPKYGPTTAASDVYSLGAILYHLLTGRPPFMAETITQTLRLVTESEPLSPRLLNPDLPRDLETICLKCLEKDPLRRYSSALELAEELGRFLKDEPIRARPIGTPARLGRWCLRNPGLAAALGATTALLLIVVIGSPVAIIRINAARNQEAALRIRAEGAERQQASLREEAQNAQASEAQARRRAEAQELAARKKAYASDMKLLQLALAEDDLGRAQELLNRQRPQPGEQDLRGWEWRYFWQFCQSDAAYTLCQSSNPVLSVSFSSDGSLLAIGTPGESGGGAGPFSGEASVWDLATRRMVSRYRESRITSHRLAFAPSGEVAFGDFSNGRASIVLWNNHARKESRRLPVNAPVGDLVFTDDGRLYATGGGRSNNVTVWDIVEGNQLRNFTARIVNIVERMAMAVARDGSKSAHSLPGSAVGFVQIVHADGTAEPSFRVADEIVTALAFSPDGKRLLTAGGYAESTIKLWDARTRQNIGILAGHRGWVSGLKFLPDGETLVSSSADRTIRLWNFETRQGIRTLHGYGGELLTIDVSPDGRWLASGGKDGSVILWDITATTHRPARYRTFPVNRLWWDYSPNGEWLGAMPKGRISFYDATTLELVSQPALPLTNITSFAFSPDMRLLLVGGARGNLAAWDMQAQRVVTNFMPHSSPTLLNVVHKGATNGPSLLSYGMEGAFRLWDLTTWQELRKWSVDPRVAWEVNPTANVVATVDGEGWVELIPINNPDNRKRFKGQTRVKANDLSPDGKTFASASSNGTVEIWDTGTLTRRALLRGVLQGYHGVTFSGDGERVAAGSGGQEAIKMWELQSLEEVATLTGEGSNFNYMAFSPDGNTLAAENWNGLLHLWTAPSWEHITEIEKARSSVSR